MIEKLNDLDELLEICMQWVGGIIGLNNNNSNNNNILYNNIYIIIIYYNIL